MKIRFISVILLSVLFLSSNAQLLINGEFRSRFNADHGFKVPVTNEESIKYFVDQRSRVSMNFNADKYKIKFTLQDARLWGNNDLFSKTGPMGNSYSLGVYEALVDINLYPNYNLVIGRQEWNYNDQRILGTRNIWTSGLTYDGMLLKYASPTKGLFVDLGLSYNNDGTVAGFVDNTSWNPDNLKTMNFLNFHKKFSDLLSVSLMFTLSGKVDPSNNNLLGTGTHGIYLNYNTGKKSQNGLFFTFSTYYQHGTDSKKDSENNFKKISAYLMAAELGLRTFEKRLEMASGVELISGKDYTKTDADYNKTRYSFDLFYGARFPYYAGNMNHFIIQDSFLTGTKGGGYANPYININYELNNNNLINLTYHMPILTTPVTAHVNINPETRKPVGMETNSQGDIVYWKGNLGNYIDIGLTRKFSNDISLKSGFSYALISDIKNQMVFGYKNETTKELYNTNQNFYFWTILTIKPVFFKN